MKTRIAHRVAPLAVTAAFLAAAGLGLGGTAVAQANESDAGSGQIAGILETLAGAQSDAGATETAIPDEATGAGPSAGNPGAGDDATAGTQTTQAQLANDPFAMQFSIDGTVVQLPCTVADLARAGFALAPEDAGGVLENGYTVAASLYYGDPEDYVSLTATIYNTSGTALPFEECMVDSVYFSWFLLEGHQIEIAGGIALGTSSQAEVEAVYGPAADPFVDEGYVSFDCEDPEDDRTSLDFTFDDDVLTDLCLDSSAEYEPFAASQPDGAETPEATEAPSGATGEGGTADIDAAQSGAASSTGTEDEVDIAGEEPADTVADDEAAAKLADFLDKKASDSSPSAPVADSKAPEGATSSAADADSANAAGGPATAKLSDDPFSFQVAIDGAIIQLPCPVGDLAALGFTLEGDVADDLLEDGYETSATLFFGDPDDYVYAIATIANASGSAQKLSDCTVTYLSLDSRSLEGHTVAIPGGIEIGVTTVDEALAVFGEPAFDWTSDDGTARSFDFNPTPDDFWRSISLWFDDGVLTEITLSTVIE